MPCSFALQNASENREIKTFSTAFRETANLKSHRIQVPRFSAAAINPATQ